MCKPKLPTNEEIESGNTAVPLGYWDGKGRWYPNLKLSIPIGKQYEHNVTYGYIKITPED